MTKPREETARNTMGGQKVAMEIVKGQLADMVNDIHTELDAELLSDSELAQLAKYLSFNLICKLIFVFILLPQPNQKASFTDPYCFLFFT